MGPVGTGGPAIGAMDVDLVKPSTGIVGAATLSAGDGVGVATLRTGVGGVTTGGVSFGATTNTGNDEATISPSIDDVNCHASTTTSALACSITDSVTVPNGRRFFRAGASV